MRKFAVLFFLSLPLFFVNASFSQNLGPDQLVQKVTEDVLAAIKTDKELASGDKQKALKLAEEKILPHVDFELATRLAVGRAWSKATPEQRRKLIDEFRQMLVRTYSNAIDSYQGQTMKVLPSRGKPDADEATVRTQFIRAGGQPLPIEFQARKTDEGWKIYDIAVEGVSLVLTYRSEFDSVVRQGGIESLIKRLQEKNVPAKVS